MRTVLAAASSGVLRLLFVAALLTMGAIPAGCFSMSAVAPAAGLEVDGDPTLHERVTFNSGAPALIESAWGTSGSFVLVHPIVNGRDIGWFILDTGASGSTITGDAARRAGATEFGTTMIQGMTATTVYRCESLELGPMRFEGLHITGLDMASSSQVFGHPIAGILGRNVFESAIVVLDGPARQVRIFDPSTPGAIERAVSMAWVPSTVEWLPITMRRELPHVPVRFDGDHEASFILDTGADATIHFFDDTVDRYGLLNSQGVRITGTKTQVTFGHRASISDGTIQDVRLGAKQVGPSSASFARPGDGVSKHLSESAGLVGMGIMREFVVVIDEPAQRVAFIGGPR